MKFGEIQKLRDTRASLVKQANDLMATAKTEKRDLTAAEAEQWDKLHADVDSLAGQIKREERQLTANASLEERGGYRPGDVDPNQRRELTDDERKEEVQKRNRAIGSWLRIGMLDLPPEQRAIVSALNSNNADERNEIRALSGGTSSAGGYTIAPDTSFYGQIMEGMKEYGVDEGLFEVITTDTGASLPIPTNDDTANTGAAATENTDPGDADDLTFGQIELRAFLRTSKMLKVSNVLIQDSSVNVEQYVGRKLGERLARKKAADLTTGAGDANAPMGIVTAATLGKTAASASALTWQELVDLKHSVDPVHRKNARFMFHDTTLASLKKLTDGQGRPLFQAGLSVGAPDTIDGTPYVINQNMATAAVNAKTVLYGNLKKFMVRNVKGFIVQRLVERFAEANQTAFIGFARWDSDLIDAGDHPIKYLKQAAA